MPIPGPSWAFFGLFAGAWKAAIIAGVALAVLGRTGLWQHPMLRLLRPWTSASRPASAAETAVRARRNDRLFWFFTIVCAAAVAAWIVSRALISASVHNTPAPLN